MNDTLRKKLERQLYKKSLYHFVKAFWHVVDPNPFVDGKLVQFYCEVFQYFCRDWVGYTPIDIKLPEASENLEIIDVRESKKNLNLNVPPRHMKSKIFNVFGPTWLWLSYPVVAVSVSHNTALASDMNGQRAKLVHSDEFQELFGDKIHLVSQSAYALKTKEGGDLRSQARDSFTGFGADIIINDDLTNAETARRDQAEMFSAWSYFQNTMPSRINNIEKCLIMNIQQRLAPNDITGHILDDPKLAARYTHVIIRAIFEKDTILVCPISGTLLYFKKGEALWPERFSDNYESLRDQVGEAVFETQYMQRPIASDKTVVKESMIHSAALTEVPDIILDSDMIYGSHDFPVKDKESSDFLGSVLAYRSGRTLYIKDCLEKKMAFVASINYVEALENMYSGIVQIIEDKANGSPIIQQTQDRVPGIQAFNPGTASKTQRLESASLYMNNIVFVKSQFNKLSQSYEFSPAVQNLIRRLLAFPFVEHDDIIDAFSQLVLFVFMDRKFMVYGRSFNDDNIIKASDIDVQYSYVFFNREGDIWKVCEIGVKYGSSTVLTVMREMRFKSNIDEALKKIKEFAPKEKVFIDCSASESLYGAYMKGMSIDRHPIDDFDKSVAQLNLAMSKKKIKICHDCKSTIADIENFKLAKTKDESSKYASKKDGFVACIRTAIKQFGSSDF